MLKFNELRIDENKNLIVDASVLDVIADPNRTIAINSIRVGYGTNEDTIDYYKTIYYDTNYFDNLDYSEPTGDNDYKFKFTINSSVSVDMLSVYECDDYLFTVVGIESGDTLATKKLVCIYDNNTSITLTSTSLTKVSGEGADIIDFTAYTSSIEQKKYLRGFRLVIPLASAEIINTIGSVTNTLIYVKVGIDIPSDVWEELGNCSNAEYIEGYAYDRCLIVNKVFDYLKELDTPCTGISNLANYITQINGLQIAIESNRFVLANKYWTKFFANNQTIGTHSSNCNCCH
jgi:hypothetical protein